MKLQPSEIVSFVAGLALSIGVGVVLNMHGMTDHSEHHDNHPIADPFDSEYHVHADFHIVVNDTLVDLSGDTFQTTGQQELHKDAHLHDNNGDVKHIHNRDVTFTGFLDSLGITLTDDCVTLDNEYCSNETNQLYMYVNDELYSSPLTQYVPVDDDRILLYYGSIDNPQLDTYLNNVPDDACFYSGTCPERGVAPDESCGLSCEL
jgi:hypothetical protein